MPNLNRVMLMGNLTRDPELRYLPSNVAVVSFGLAINRHWRNQQGEPQEETTFVDCEAFSRSAEVINQYLKKGRPIFVEGRLKLDQWQDKDGNNRSKMKVIVETFQFVDSKGSSDDGSGEAGGDSNRDSGYGQSTRPRPAGRGNNPASGNSSARGASSSADSQQPPPHEPIDEDDIPF